MPTYQQIMEMDFAALTGAADGWKNMAAKFKTLEDTFAREVQSVSTGSGWTGESANASAQSFAVTRQEYDAAQKEARAMESLLRDAHARFVELKSAVKSAVADAVDAGMKVSDGGVASYDFSRVDAAAAKTVRHDPNLPDVEHSYTRNITNAVKAVNEYDEDVKRALLNASGADGGWPFGFNSKPVGDVEAVEALALTDKIRSGKASPEELKHYQELLRQNADDKHFSEAYLHALGAEDLVRLADQMNIAANGRDVSAGDKKLYESITTSLAATIASGTKDPNSYAYKPFVEGLKDFGDDSLDKLLPVHGYQVLTTLMANGDGYGKEFLNDLGNGIIEAEKDGTNWSHAYDPKRPNIVVDPLDALLKTMSEDPKAAEYFLDPAAEGNKNDHLKYLLTEREWDDYSYMAPLYGPPHELEGTPKAEGLGAAIQAAATGHEPGEKLGPPGPHTEGQARVMHNAIRLLDNEMGGDEFPEHLENLRQPMAKAMVDYVADTHVIFNGQKTDYGGIGGSDAIYGAGEEAHIAVGQGSLVRVARGIADDGPAFALLYEAERSYAADQMAVAPTFDGDRLHGESADWNSRSSDIGAALGALNGVGADVYKDREDDRIEWAEDTAEYTAISANGLIGEIPVVGTAGGALIDTVKYDWVKDVTEAAEEQGKQESSKNYAKGMDGANLLLETWAKERKVENLNAFDVAQDQMRDGYTAGRGAAASHLH
ncbi:hypothetical protein HHL19_00250 [Streptomyces sp. R302]|uniref:DUF6571 family protein n=1 Tax=unclassified Streptomyces TaxID=2593676 RepID=UPI00145DD382|nr:MULTISPECIES: DUF6571 family protein [unclassified Streptomyces]NML48805.1 hypothetical protein [Streptomyces sp. R301]NML77132.1 hypothetical protein [Streptomyces sp. R302]